MNLTWLGIVVLVLIASACITGFQKGFVKEVVATFFVLFSIWQLWVPEALDEAAFLGRERQFIIWLRKTAGGL